MSPRKFFCVVTAVLSLASIAANAAIFTFQFSGTVTYGGPMAVLPGSPLTGTFAYDTSTLPAITYKGYADYQIPAPFAISASVGGHTITANNLDVAIWNHYKGNVEDMVMLSGGPAVVDGTTYPNGAFGFQLSSAPRNNRALNGTQLPKSFNVNDFNASPTLNYGFLQSDGGPTGQLLQFTIDSIVVIQTIP